MKFDNINGVSVVTLEKNDVLMIKKDDEPYAITITRNGDKVDISGVSDIIGSIKGAGMLEKICVPPVISSQDIIDKCDRWLEMFRKIHDKFKELVLKDKYREQSITMVVSFEAPKNGIKPGTISLALNRYNITIQDGANIKVDAIDKDVYAYLVANVLDYYVSKNYKDTKINNWDINFNWIMYSNEPKIGRNDPIIASLSSLMESYYFANIVHGILSVHDLGVSSEQIIDNLRKKIVNQPIRDLFDEGIDYTARQYAHIINEADVNTPGRKMAKKDTNK